MQANQPLDSVTTVNTQGSGPSEFRSLLPSVSRLFRHGVLTLALLGSLGAGSAFAETATAKAAPKSLALPKAVPVAGKPVIKKTPGSAPAQLAARPIPRPAEEVIPVTPSRVRLDFVDADVQEVFRALAAQTRTNIVVSPEVKGVITASLRGMSVEDALDAVSRMAGVAYRRVDDTYFVAPKARLDEMFAAPALTQTYTVKAADPAELAAVIKAAIPTLLEAVTAGRSLLVLKGPREAVEKALAILPSLDVSTTPEAPNVVTRIIDIHHIDPLTTMTTLNDLYSQAGLRITSAPNLYYPSTNIAGGSVTGGGGGGASSGGGGGASGGGGGGGATEMTMPSTRILLTGPVDLVDRAEQMVRQLDQAPPQFEIQARVLDVSTNKLAQRGINWSYTNTFNFEELGEAVEQIGGGQIFGVIPALRVGTLARTSPFNLSAQIAGAITSGDARILAEPSIRVIEGRTARIFIGDTITAVVDRTVTPTGTNITTREFTPGITLIVSGNATPDGEITLDVKPTVSFLTSLTVEGIDFPVPQIRERSAQTTIRLRDGDTMVLGGLMQDEDIKRMSKVPILGDLPFFGNLFRSRTTDKRRSEVVIFLTTRLLKG